MRGGVADDWRFSGIVLSPVIVCGLGAGCVQETLAVLDAVADVGHAPVRIEFDPSAICLGDPFHPIPCPLGLPPAAKGFVGSAVVEFLGTSKRAYLDLFHSEGGSILYQMNVLAPPASP